jgi:hypothetical protein
VNFEEYEPICGSFAQNLLMRTDSASFWFLTFCLEHDIQIPKAKSCLNDEPSEI